MIFFFYKSCFKLFILIDKGLYTLTTDLDVICKKLCHVNLNKLIQHIHNKLFLKSIVAPKINVDHPENQIS